MKKFEGSEVLMIELGGIRFVKENYMLWILCNHEWRYKAGDPWRRAEAGQYHHLGDYREIKIGSKTYSVDLNGFEEVPQISTEYMIRAIAQKLDLLEYTNAKIYALLEHERVELGCERLKNILRDCNMLKTVHATNSRTLYHFQWNNIDIPDELLKYEKEIKSVYERVCK